MPSLAALAALAAAALAALLAAWPELVLKVPGKGFLLYHLLAGAPIPPYIVQDQWKDDSKWLRPGDVVLAVNTKSGTTWTMALAHAIRIRGADPVFKSIIDVVPWADLVRYPGETLEERIEYFKRASADFFYAIYKTHCFPDYISLRPDVKYIVGIRNLYEVTLSLRSFYRGHTAEFKKMWGGFPPPLATEDDFYTMMFVDKGDGKSFFEDVIVNFIRAWWPYRNRPNILFVRYYDRVADPSRDVDVIASFLGTTLTPEEKKRVLAQSNFEYMKQNDHRFLYSFRGDEFIQRIKGKECEGMSLIEAGNMIVKGKERQASEIPESWKTAIDETCARLLNRAICDYLNKNAPSPMPDVEISLS